MIEIYNIRTLKVCISKILYTPVGNRFRLGSKFSETSIQDCRFIFLIYSGQTRFIEIGFNSNSVYKVLCFIFRQTDINKFLINTLEYFKNVRDFK